MADYTPPVVPWIMGTQRAMARCLALEIAKARGETWARMPPAMRDARVDQAEEAIRAWVAVRAVVTFDNEWREPT